jgi:hypothetical protein
MRFAAGMAASNASSNPHGLAGDFFSSPRFHS